MKQSEKYLNLINEDYQLDPTHPEYYGFLNTNPSDSGEFTTIATYIAQNPEKYKDVLNKLNLEIGFNSCKEEMVFVRKCS
jgi:hypothetical protein